MRSVNALLFQFSTLKTFKGHLMSARYLGFLLIWLHFTILCSSFQVRYHLQHQKKTSVVKSRLIPQRCNWNDFQSNDVQVKRAGNSSPLCFIYSAAWIGLVSYAYTLAPGATPVATSRDTELLLNCIYSPFDGSNVLFTAIFYSLGIIPAIFSCLLLPSAKKCKVPASPFLVGSFALGYFAQKRRRCI